MLDEKWLEFLISGLNPGDGIIASRVTRDDIFTGLDKNRRVRVSD